MNGALGIGTSSALGGNSIVLGDNDTGFKQNGDGNLDVYANSVHIMRFVSGSIQSNKTINITGRVNPSITVTLIPAMSGISGLVVLPHTNLRTMA